jgi:carbamoyl-phosphate synthase large subunit
LSKSKQVRVLITSIGRRVELVEAFRGAAGRLGVALRLYGADITMLAPAMHQVDQAVLVPAIRSSKFVPVLLEFVRRQRIALLVPTLDTELPKLSAARSLFAKHGCTVLVSSRRVVQVCRDKLATFRWLRRNRIDTPQTFLPGELPPPRQRRFPYFLKARFGSAARGATRIDDAEALRFWLGCVPQPIVQEYLPGSEYTQDVYCGLDGQVRCVVPRERLEVRGGEVQKARIVKDARLIEICTRVVDVLAECIGVITIQCIVGPRGRVSVVEINPRFGGGAPLAIRAGADFPRWLLAERMGRRIRIRPDSYRDGLCMLRYDASVFWQQPGS